MNLLDSSPRLAEDAFDTQPVHDLRPRGERKPGSQRGPRAARHSRWTGYAGGLFSAQGRQARSPASLAAAGFHRQERVLGGTAKRCFDVAAALGALLIMAPVMLFIALAILVTMGRPVLFSQQRVGFGRTPFRCLKFRTMVHDAQERLERYLAHNGEAAQAWRDTQKLKHDPRVTWLGHFLRKSSLDELPQLFNILRGEMSCVGPRPVLASELGRYGPHAEDYASAKPGLTGIWQVSGRSNTTYAHRINCDRFYARRWSFALDLMVILRTIPALTRFRETG